MSAFKVNGGLLFADGPVERDQDQAAAARGARLLARRPHGAARRRRAVLLRLLLREHQPDRLLAGDAGADDAGQRHHLHGRHADRSAAERPADSADRSRARAAQPRSGRTSARCISPIATTPYYTRWEANLQRDLGNGLLAAFIYVGSRGTDLPVPRADQQHPDAVPVDLAQPRQRDRDAPHRQRAEPVHRAAAGQHDQRRHRAAAAAAAAVPGVRHDQRRGIHRLGSLSRRDGADREALPRSATR